MNKRGDRVGGRDMQGREARLKAAREFAGLGSASEAARRHGWVEVTYRSHENGGRDYKIDQAETYAAAFGVSVDWLFYGRGQAPARVALLTNVSTPESDQNSAVNGIISTKPAPLSRRSLPVYGLAKAGDEGAIVWTDAPRDYIDCPVALENVPDAYAVYVVGDSMQDRYFPGEAVHVNPAKPPRRNDFVVAQIVDPTTGETVALVKRLVSQDGGNLVLAQLNPPREFTFSMRIVRAVHRIVGLSSE